jgi:hypothetical protein
MKISIGKMFRVALFSLPLALPATALAQSAGSDPGTEPQPMGQQPGSTDTGKMNEAPPPEGQQATPEGEKATPEGEKATPEGEKAKPEGEKAKKKHDTSGQQY